MFLWSLVKTGQTVYEELLTRNDGQLLIPIAHFELIVLMQTKNSFSYNTHITNAFTYEPSHV